VGTQIGEAIRLHRPDLSRRQVTDRVVELLGLVGIPHPGDRRRQYPHEFSGGLRQRVMIAMAIANEPALLIADEPTTALDVTIQAQVLGVLKEVREKVGASMVIISHNLGLIAEVADRVAVIYGGRVMETSGVEALFASPRHPYTVGLMASLPRLDVSAETLYSIPGQPPQLDSRPPGCVFNPRCTLRQGRSICVDQVPPLLPIAPSHSAACHFSDSVPAWVATMESSPVVARVGKDD
jgi:peptide/nickel transport system ATP-binding protein